MRFLEILISLILIAVLIVLICLYPLNSIVLTIALVLYGMLLTYHPLYYLMVLSALLPILDFSPLSGWLFINEFDYFFILTLIVLFIKQKQPDKKNGHAGSITLTGKILLSFFAVSVCISSVINLYPLPLIDLNSFSNYYSPYNSLRISKGFFEAIILVLLTFKFQDTKENIQARLIIGTLIGLGGVAFVGIWERQIFSGLINVDYVYRITSFFSEMHTGGAFLDGFLAFTIPMISYVFYKFKNKYIQGVAGVLFFLSLYTLVATLSRIVYGTFLISVMILITGFFYIIDFKKRFLLTSIIISIISLCIVLPFFKGDFIQERFGSLSEDIDIRLNHWSDAIDKMNPEFSTKLFGMGIGRYPKIHHETRFGKEKPATYKFIKEGDNVYLELIAGKNLYFGQRIKLDQNEVYIVSCDIRNKVNKTKLFTALCEKSHLYSFNCISNEINVENTNGEWKHYEIKIDHPQIGQGRFYQKKPVEFAVFLGDGILEVDNIKLINSRGNNLLQNGDFLQGINFWFFTADDHLSWHIKNIWVSLYFDQGWFGVISFFLLISYVLVFLFVKIIKKDFFSLIVFCSIISFLTVGLIDSLFDSPRIFTLFILFVCFSIYNTEPQQS